MTKKQVGLNYFNNKIKELETTKVFYFDEEQTEALNYHVKFSSTKIQEVILELTQTKGYCTENKDESLDGDLNIYKYLEFLIFKKFTDTEKLLKDKDFAYKLKFSKNLYDTGIIELFLNTVFDQAEVQKVVDKLQEFLIKSDMFIEDMKNTKE